MRKKTTIIALALAVFSITGAHAETEIFNRPNKDKQSAKTHEAVPAPGQPLTQQGVPDVAIQQRQKKLLSTAPGQINPGKQACSQEDAEAIMKIDASLATTIDEGSDPKDAENRKWFDYLKDRDHVRELISLYQRCGAFLYMKKHPEKAAEMEAKKAAAMQGLTPPAVQKKQ